MAEFGKIIGFVRTHEGGYVNDPNDAGGETYCGISRKHNPLWIGWTVVDKNKPLRYNAIIKHDALQEMVNNYYYKQYWCAIGGDALHSQSVANMAFDWQVNSGDICTRALQRLVGVTPDGIVGAQTITAVNAHPASHLLNALKQKRIEFYSDLVRRIPQNARYLKGWLKRTNAVPQ